MVKVHCYLGMIGLLRLQNIARIDEKIHSYGPELLYPVIRTCNRSELIRIIQRTCRFRHYQECILEVEDNIAIDYYF